MAVNPQLLNTQFNKMKIVYIAHCIGGDVAANLADLRRIIREINLTRPDVVPLVPYYADIVSLDDHNPEERERGIANDMAVIRSGLVQEMWLTGPKLSPGMRAERQLAADMRIPVVDMIGQFSGHDVPHDQQKATEYQKHTGDWLGVLAAVVPYLETLEADNIHDPGVGLRRDQELTDLLQDVKDIVAAAEAVKALEGNQPRTFAQELTGLINKYSQEADSNTPDFILAAYVINGLVAFHSAVKAREQWYGREVLGRKPFPTGGVFPSGTANERKAQYLRAIAKTPYAGNLAGNAPKIEKGLKFMAQYLDGAIITVTNANETTNLLSVDIENTQGHKWNEDGWNLEHTKWGFERGEYWEVDKNTVIVKVVGEGQVQTGDGCIFTVKRDTEPEANA